MSNRFLQQSWHLKDSLTLGQLQEPARDLSSNIEQHNLFGISQRAKSSRFTTAGRPRQKHQPIVVVGDARESLLNLIYYDLRLHSPTGAGPQAPPPNTHASTSSFLNSNASHCMLHAIAT